LYNYTTIANVNYNSHMQDL